MMLMVAMMVFGLLGHSRSHECLRVRDGASLLAARTSAHIDGMIAHFASTAAEILMSIRICCDRSLRLQKGDSIRYSTCCRLLDCLVRV